MSIFLYLLIVLNLILIIHCDEETQCMLTKSSPVNVTNKYINIYIINLAFSQS